MFKSLFFANAAELQFPSSSLQSKNVIVIVPTHVGSKDTLPKKLMALASKILPTTTLGIALKRSKHD